MTIKELRESKGLSQGKFADSIRIGRTAIVGYEKGKFKPSEEVAAKIKEVYGITVDEAAPAPVEKKKTTKRGKKAAAPTAEMTPVVEEKKPAPKKRVGRKKAEAAPAVEEKKPAKRGKNAGVTVVIQSPMGGSITPEEILAKVGPVDAVYIRVDENKAYWVKGDETGAIDLW